MRTFKLWAPYHFGYGNQDSNLELDYFFDRQILFQAHIYSQINFVPKVGMFAENSVDKMKIY